MRGAPQERWKAFETLTAASARYPNSGLGGKASGTGNDFTQQAPQDAHSGSDGATSHAQTATQPAQSQQARTSNTSDAGAQPEHLAELLATQPAPQNQHHDLGGAVPRLIRNSRSNSNVIVLSRASITSSSLEMSTN